MRLEDDMVDLFGEILQYSIQISPGDTIILRVAPLKKHTYHLCE